MEHKMKHFILAVHICAAAILVCGCEEEKSARGRIEIYYSLNKAEGVEPSWQTAVWLEDDQGNMTTILVSDYLSYGGYKDKRVCPDWSSKCNWDKQDPKILSAVTCATPKLKGNVLKVTCKKAGIRDGTYNYFVQTHIEEKYNILAKGTITIDSTTPDENTAVLTYSPSEHKRAGGILSDVKAKYIP